MRFPVSLRWLACAIAAGLGLVWLYERAAADAWETRAAALTQEQQHLSRLQAERARLDEKLAELTGVTAEPLTGALRVGEQPASPTKWQVGEWTSASTWHNAGRSTPRATLSTLLAAATGGDLAILRDALDFDDANRAKARAWFDSLPVASRLLYGTPEELVAGVTLSNIPPTHAQVSWLHQADADHAIMGLLLAEPASAAPSPLAYQPAVGNFPPGLVGSSAYRVVVLDLHRTPDGWRVKVPATAIDRLAQQLRRA